MGLDMIGGARNNLPNLFRMACLSDAIEQEGYLGM